MVFIYPLWWLSQGCWAYLDLTSLFFGSSLCFNYQNKSQTQLSHTSPWLPFPFPNCIVWNIITASKRELSLFLRDTYFWRPFILFCSHKMFVAWSDAAWSKTASIQQKNRIVLPCFPSRLERLLVFDLIMANSHYDLFLSSGASPHAGPWSASCLIL